MPQQRVGKREIPSDGLLGECGRPAARCQRRVHTLGLLESSGPGETGGSQGGRTRVYKEFSHSILNLVQRNKEIKTG